MRTGEPATPEKEQSTEPFLGQAEALLGWFRTLPEDCRVLVAFSGGVDSTVVAQAAFLALGERAVAVTGVSPSLAQVDRESAGVLARQIGIEHRNIVTPEFENPSYIANDGTRCYHCKSALYGVLEKLGSELARDRQDTQLGITLLVSGANADDLADYRPGLRAAAEFEVRHPLAELGFDKGTIREIASHWGLPNAEKPASPCLASRLAVGVEVTSERLSRVEGAEALLRALKFSPVRVRVHPGEHARIELAEEQIARLLEPEIRKSVLKHLRELGFLFVSLDLQGFESGSLNRLIPAEMLRQARIDKGFASTERSSQGESSNSISTER